MPRVGFDHMIPVLERAKMVDAVDRQATVIGVFMDRFTYKRSSSTKILNKIWFSTIRLNTKLQQQISINTFLCWTVLEPESRRILSSES
jgi:hypothetical protein